MKKFFRNNGLSLVLFGLFTIFLIGQAVTGFHVYNDDQIEHGQHTVTFSKYVETGHFGEAVFENWESEFLQMAMYVLLTIWLFQIGSAESKDPEAMGHDPADNDPGRKKPAGHKYRSFLYRNSLTLSLFSLFLVSFLLHGATGARAYSEEQLAHGSEEVSMVEYMETSQFWFESMQNWQSEFLAIGSILVLSIYLRQQGSPQSKPLKEGNSETGS
jgi:hypothetical protein